jgi:hypothetical protein
MPLSPLRTLRIPSEYALSFDGVDDYVAVQNSASLNITDMITIEVWVKPNNLYQWAGIVEKRGSGYDGYAMLMWNTNYIFMELTGLGVKVISSSLEAGKWYHLVGTWRGDTGEACFYTNGQLTSSQTRTGINPTNNSRLFIGCRGQNDKPNYYFNGFIDEVRIYNRALSANEILWNYNYPYNPIRNGLVLWLPGTDEAIQPPTWYDKSNFVNNGTIYGAQKTQLIRKPVRTLAATRVLASAR